MREPDLVSVVRAHAVPIDPAAAAAPLLEMIDPPAPIVLIGSRPKIMFRARLGVSRHSSVVRTVP